MKLELTVNCGQCGKQNSIHAIAGQQSPDVDCECGARIFGIGEIEVPDGVLVKSQQELGDGDFPLAIVLAAMATDCELARLFFKWKRIDALRTLVAPDEEKLETELRNYSVKEKLDKIAELLVKVTLDAYAMAHPEICREATRLGMADLFIS